MPMFESSRSNDARITLCIFPHLREFVAVDNRESLPDGPRVRVLTLDDVLGDDYASRMEAEFSGLMRRENLSFLELMGMPQEVEAAIRTQALRIILEHLGEVAGTDGGAMENVGVLVFTGTLLQIQPDQLQRAIDGIFGELLPQDRLEELVSKLSEFVSAEREAVSRANKGEIKKLIKGDGGPYLTLWESGGN